MSGENIEIVRRTLAAWNRGDMDAVSEPFAPDVHITPHPGWPEAEEYVGRDAHAQALKDMRDGFERDWLEIGDVVALDDERVMADVEWCGVPVGGETGELHFGAVLVYRIRQGRIVDLAYFRDKESALEAAGLRE